MNKITTLISTLTTPKNLIPQDGIRFWQEKVLLNLLFFSGVLGFITWIPSVALSIKEGLWVVAFADTLMLGWVLGMFLRPGLSYTFRAMSIPTISYLLGMVLILTLGPFGAGPAWLFFFPILTGVLLGPKSAYRALVLNAITVALIGGLIQLNLTNFLSQANFKAWHLAIENPMEKWVVICFNFMLLNILATLSVTTILNGLHNSLEELGVSEKKHRQIFENILDVYFETSLEGIILEISPSIEQVSSYSQKGLKGKPLQTVYKDPGKRKDFLEKLFRNGHIQNYEIHLLDKTGQTRICSVNARLLRDKNNNPERIIGIFRDITEQIAMAKKEKDLEERLNRSRKMEAIGMLAGGVAHDLNNVLSGVVTYPELLLLDQPPKSPMADALNIIHSSGLRATEIVQDLLTLSRRGVMTREVVDLNAIASEFLRTPEYEKILSFHPHVSVKQNLAAEFPFLKGSGIHLQKTIMNLISNAAEAQIDMGTITISTTNRHLDNPVKGYDRVAAGDYVVLTVEDQGTGIDPEDVKRIFEPFFTKKVMGRSGTGLGMAVVWGTVQDHGAYIDVISSPGTGTRFDLYFPVTADKPNVRPESICMGDLMGNNETILIVDDVAEQRTIAGTILERLGYKVLAVASGEEAVSYLASNTADLLLLDMIMDPGIDGLETFRRIREFRPNQKAIIASGFSQSHQVRQTLALGAGQYIKKPYTIEKIGLAVQKELSGNTCPESFPGKDHHGAV
ncbi:MAG: response regulator [Proteobacteria bacterium]|nr:response regulator [Pseudomonadota bacterium]